MGRGSVDGGGAVLDVAGDAADLGVVEHDARVVEALAEQSLAVLLRSQLHVGAQLLDDPGDLDIVAGLRAPVHDGFVLCHAAERTPRPLLVNRRVISTSR